MTSENIVNLVNTQLAQKGLVMVQHQQLNWFPASASTIDNGTLVVDSYNPAQKPLIWRGTASQTRNPSSNPDKNYQNLQKAIAKLLKDFPPPLKK